MGISVNLGGLKLQNPVTLASGTFGYASELGKLSEVNSLGAVFTKAITLEPRLGNPSPRICETPSGMLNAIGLENVGVEAFIKDKMPYLKKIKAKCIVNVAGSSIQDYAEVINRLEDVKGVDAYEINISCPNVKKGGISFSSAPTETAKIVKTLRKLTKKTLMVKLSPNVTDIVPFAKVAEEEGADVLTLINTLIGMSIDVNTAKPRIANITGGLSGPAIRPVGVAMVYKVAQAVKIPLVGIGGIVSTQDALEYIIAGASAVQIGTGTFIEPKCAINIVKGIEDFLQKKGIKNINKLIKSIQV